MASAEKVRHADLRKRLLFVASIFILAVFSFHQSSAQSYSTSTCSGVAFTFNEPGFDPSETYDWSFPTISPGGSISGASGQTAQSSVSQTLVNSTNVSATVTYSVTTSLGTSFTLVVTVKPVPVVTDRVTTICSGSNFNIVPANGSGNTVPSGTTYTWTAPVISPAGNITGSSAQSNPQIFIGQTLTNPTTAGATATYTVTPSASTCDGNPFQITVTVNPKPTLSSGPGSGAVCSGTTFGYTPTSATGSTSFSWTRSTFTGISNGSGSGTNNVNEILNNTTTSPVSVDYVYVLSANGCSNNQTISVTVNPKPVLSSTATPPAICSGNTFNYTPAAALFTSPTFTWTRSANGFVNGGATSSGSGNISEILTNSFTQTAVVNYFYTITDVNGCVSSLQQVTTGVNAAPTVASPVNINSCSGNTFSVSPSGVPVATLYSWTGPTVTSGTVTGGSAANNQYFVGQTLSNNGSTGVMQYTVTPNNNGCVGANFLVNVTVTNGNAVPAFTNVTPTSICSGTVFNMSANVTANSPTYTWTRYYSPDLSPTTNAGTGLNPAETLNFSNIGTTTPAIGHYAFTTTDGGTGCTNTQQVSVSVNPLPTLTSGQTPAAVCSNVAFSYVPSGLISGTTFNWTRATFAGITEPSSSGTGNPNESLTNSTTSAVSVTYVYNMIAPSGCTNSQNVIVSIKPTPVLSSSISPPAICSGAAVNYTPTSATGSTVFNWSRDVQSSISSGAASGQGNPSELLTNTGITAVSVPYNYTLTASGCSGTQTVTIFVNPAPNIANLVATTCSGVSFTVNPTGVPAGTTYTWGSPTFSPLGSISGSSTGTAQAGITQVLNNGTSSTATATYTITPAAGGCNGGTFTLGVNVNAVTTLSSTLTPAGICSNGTFAYVPASNTSGVSFNWTRNLVSGISNSVSTGTNNPNETLVNTTANPISVPYTYAISSPDGCVNTQTVTVSVKPLPVFSSVGSGTVCSGTIFNYTPTSATASTSFTWIRLALPTISNGAGSGTGNPAEILVNTTTNAVVVPYAYTLTANGCSNAQTVNLTVNPTPTVSDKVTSTCNSTAFTVSPTNVPTGTVYTWTVPTYSPVASITGGSAQAVSQNTISQTLTNVTNAPANATYTVTPVANSCTGNAFLITVTVNTATALSSSLTPPAVCSNAVFNYNPASNTPGASFNWTRAVVTGISNNAASGSNNPAETLINITPNPVTVTYTYALNTPNSCLNSQTVTVTVNPLPSLTSTLTPNAICSGTVFNYTPATATSGVAYTWARPVVQSISNGAGAGSGPVNPSELLVNTSINPVTVAYNYTLTANSCTNAQTVNVVVNPIPSITNQTTTICGNTTFSITPTNIPAATQYTWTVPTVNPAGAIGGTSAQATAQTNLGQLLINQTLNSAIATYTVTPVASGCSGASFTAAVTVKPTPVVTDKLLNAICAGTAFSYTPANVPAATTYTWGDPVLGPPNGLTGGSAQPLNQPLISQTLSSSNNIMDTAAYIVTPATAGCAGADFTLTVPVKPVPVLPNLKDTICTGSAFSVIPTSPILNTTYTWVAPTSVPSGSVVGGSAQGTGVPVISQTLFNPSNAIAQMVYTVTPTAAACAGPTFTLNETVGIPLAPVANKVATICSGTAFDVTPTTTPPNTTYTWGTPVVTAAGSITGSVAASTRQTNVTQTLVNVTTSINKVVYTVVPFNTGCSGSSFTATISVRPVPKATITGKPVICRYPVDTFSVSFVGQGPWSFNYTENGVAKTQSGITASPYSWVLPALALGVDSRTLAINRVNDFACVDSTDTSLFIQKINPLPVGKINSIHGAYICNGIPDSLFISYSSVDTLRFQWTRNGINLPGATIDSISTLAGGRYNAILTNQYGCIDSAIASVLLTVVSKPVLDFNYDSYCINKLIHFNNLTDTTFIGAIAWLWDMGDSTTSTFYNSTANYLTAGRRHIKLTATQLYCQNYATSKDTTINVEFPIAPVRMPSVSAYKGQQTPIAGRTVPGYRYLWTPTKGIDNPDSAHVIFNHEVTQEYLFNLISPGGCVTPDSLLVRVFDDKLVDIFIPKSFTPNGDGVNDKLYPYLTGIKTFKYFKVYNRFGKILFQSSDPDAGWNGTLNGTPQPMGIYIWVAQGVALDGSIVEKRGETLLLR